MKHNTIFQDKVEQTKKGKLGVKYSKFGLFQSKKSLLAFEQKLSQSIDLQMKCMTNL